MPKTEVAKLNNMYKRIEDLCKEKGVNITAMCREAGVPRSNLSDLKHGRTTALATVNLHRIATYFNVTIGVLLGETDAKKPADQKADGLRGLGYDELTPEEKAVIDSMIDAFLRARSAGQ